MLHHTRSLVPRGTATAHQVDVSVPGPNATLRWVRDQFPEAPQRCIGSVDLSKPGLATKQVVGNPLDRTELRGAPLRPTVHLPRRIGANWRGNRSAKGRKAVLLPRWGDLIVWMQFTHGLDHDRGGAASPTKALWLGEP